MTGWQIAITAVGGWLLILAVAMLVLGLCAAAAKPAPTPPPTLRVVCDESPVVPSAPTSGIGSSIDCEITR